jgi:predicted DNA-binding transcriptional regulator AlpA
MLNQLHDRIVREPERRQITGTSRTTWWRLERRGDAPRRVKIGDSSVGWRWSEIMVWVKTREVVNAR